MKLRINVVKNEGLRMYSANVIHKKDDNRISLHIATHGYLYARDDSHTNQYLIIGTVYSVPFIGT